MKTIYLPEDCDRSGISITYHEKSLSLSISGWFDTCCGIQGETLSIKELFKRLGITKKDIEKVLNDY